MKLLDYIRGLRKGKEAHRLEKESMQDPFLADAMDGYSQVEGSHEQRIEKIRTEISARSAKKKNTYAITWSIAASLVIGVGIGSYFLFLKNGMEEDTFLAKETVYSEEVSPLAPKEKEEVATLPPAKTKEVSTDEVTVKRTVAQAKAAPVATAPMMEETIEPTAMTDEVIAADARTPEPVIGMHKYRKYLKENLIRPTDKICADVKGKVVLTFLVDANGRPHQIEVKENLCESCDKEAIRLVREGPDWTHGTQSVEITVKF